MIKPPLHNRGGRGVVSELQGKTFGQLTVLKRVYPEGKRRNNAYWECACSCGNRHVVAGSNLRSGKTNSCGCKRKAPRKPPKPYVAPRKKLTDLEQATHHLWVEYRSTARKFDRDFDLTETDFSRLVQLPCDYCGVPPFTGRGPQSSLRRLVPLNGLDRVDSKLGYTLANVVPCCKHCNKAKLDRSRDEFIQHCRMVVAHNENRT